PKAEPEPERAAGADRAPGPDGASGTEGAPGSVEVQTVRRMWPEVLTCLSGMKRATWSLVSQYAQVLDYDGHRLLLGFPSPGLVSQCSRGAHQEFLRQALIEVLGLDCRLEAVSDGAAGRQLARAVATPAVDDVPPPEAPPDDEEPPEAATPPPAEAG